MYSLESSSRSLLLNIKKWFPLNNESGMTSGKETWYVDSLHRDSLGWHVKVKVTVTENRKTVSVQ